MVEINNKVVTSFVFTSNEAAFKTMEAKIASFRSSIKTLSAEQLFNVRDEALKNLDNTFASLEDKREQLNQLQNKASEFAGETGKEGGFYQELSNRIKTTSQEVNALTDTYNVQKSVVGSLTAATARFGGTRENFEFIRYAAGKLNVEFSSVAKAMDKLNFVVLKNGDILDRVSGKTIKYSTAMNKLNKETRRFDFSNLSLLFGFMAIQRATRSMIRSMVTTYQKANEDTQGLGKSTWELQAAWEFFKYSLIDALTSSSIFKIIVEWLVNIIKKFNELSPKAKSFIAFAIVFTFIAATIGLAIIQLKMFAGAIVTSSTTSISAIMGIIGKFIIWLAIGYLLIGVFQGIGNNIKRVSSDGKTQVFGLSDAFIYLIRVIMMLKEFIIIGTDAFLTFFEVGFSGIMGIITDIQRLIKWIEILTKKWQIWIAEKTGGKTSRLEKELEQLQKEKKALDELSNTFAKAGKEIYTGFSNQYTKSFKEMWDETDVFGTTKILETSLTDTGKTLSNSTTNNKITNTNISVGDINVQTESAINDTTTLAETIWSIFSTRIENEISKKIDSVNN